MRKRNKENMGLPSRWRYYHGAYYYQVPPGEEILWEGKQQFRLGSALTEAYRNFAERVSWKDDVNSMCELLDRYLIEVVPLKAPATQRSNRIGIKRLRGFFAGNPVQAIRPKHIYSFREICNKRHGAISCNRDLEVLSHAFTKAIEWGVIDEHPMVGKKVTKNPAARRKRYVEDWEVVQFLSIASPFLQMYIELKLILGLRKGDMLSIMHACMASDGLHVTPRKTAASSARSIIYEWTPDLRLAIQSIVKRKGNMESPYLFCTRQGLPYIKEDGTTSGFDSIWQRTMYKALNSTNLVERFTEHDLRAKVASDTSADHAKELMGHSDSKITDRVYRRKTEVIQPAR